MTTSHHGSALRYWISPTAIWTSEHAEEHRGRHARCPGSSRRRRQRKTPTTSSPIPNTAVARTWTYTVSVIPSPSRRMSWPPECGPEAVATVPVTTSAAQAATPDGGDGAQPGRPGRPGERRCAWLHASSATTTAPATTTSASRKCDITATGWRSSSTVTPPSGICATVPSARRRARRCAPSAASPATRRAASHVINGEHDADERDEAVAELDRGVATLLGERLVAAPRPVVAAEPRGGQPDDGTARDDDPEREDGRRRELEEPARPTPLDARAPLDDADARRSLASTLLTETPRPRRP